MLGMLAAGIGGSLVSSALGMREARKNRSFQKAMSNSAHQREVEDLRAAGLNPILSAGGKGASTPGGAQGSIHDLSSGMAHGASSSLTSAQAARASLDARLSRDALKYYDKNPEAKKTLAGATLADRVGLPPAAGGFLSTAKDIAGKGKANIYKAVDWIGEPIIDRINREDYIKRKREREYTTMPSGIRIRKSN